MREDPTVPPLLAINPLAGLMSRRLLSLPNYRVSRLKAERLAGRKRPPPQGRRLRVGRARQPGLAVHDLRFWLRLGLALRRPRRSTGTRNMSVTRWPLVHASQQTGNGVYIPPESSVNRHHVVPLSPRQMQLQQQGSKGSNEYAVGRPPSITTPLCSATSHNRQPQGFVCGCAVAAEFDALVGRRRLL